MDNAMRFCWEPLRIGFVCAVLVGVAGRGWTQNLIKNGGFETGRADKPNLAADWSQNEAASLSTDHPHSGQGCMRLGANGGSVSQQVTVKGNAFCRIRFWYRVERPRDMRGKVIQGNEAAGPLRVWIDEAKGVIARACPFFGYAEEWAEASSYFYAEKDGSTMLTFIARQLGGTSAVCLDDVSVEEAPPEDFRRPNLIFDGGIENGGYAFLMGYGDRKNIEAGLVSLEVDPTEFMDGRHCLKITASEGAGGAGVMSNEFPVLAGRTYTFSLWLKTDQSQCLVQVGFASDVFPHPWCYCFQRTLVGKHWSRFTATYTVPPKPEGERGSKMPCVFRISFEGKATVWVDDVEISMTSTERAR